MLIKICRHEIQSFNYKLIEFQVATHKKTHKYIINDVNKIKLSFFERKKDTHTIHMHRQGKGDTHKKQRCTMTMKVIIGTVCIHTD